MIRVTMRGSLLILLFLVLSTAVAAAQERATLSTALNQSALQPGKDAVLAVILDIEPGFHSQSNKPLDPNLFPFKIALDANPALEPQSPVYPEGHIEDYPQLGRMSVYSGRAVAYVPIKVKSSAQPGPITITGNLD